MAISPSIADMPWLGQPADPITSFLKGTQAGSNIAHVGLARHQAAMEEEKQAAAISMAAQRMTLEKEQAAQESQLFPYKLLEQKQRSQLNELNLTIGQQQLRDQVENTQALGEVSGLIGNSLKSGDPDTGMAAAFDTAAKHPKLWGDERFKGLLNELTTSKKTIEQGNLLQERIRHDRALENPLEKPTAAIKNTKEMSDLRSRIASSNDPNEKANLKAQLEDLQALAIPAGETITSTVDPNTGQPITTISRGKQGAAGGEKAAEVSDAAINTVRLGSRALKALSESTTGLRGVVNRDVLAPLAQVSPKLYSESVSKSVKAESLISEFNTMILKSLRPGAYLNRQEINFITAGLPSLKANESLPEAQDRVHETLKTIADVSRQHIKRSGLPIPPEFMKRREIAESVVNGKMTQAQALDAMSNSPYIRLNPQTGEYEDIQ